MCDDLPTEPDVTRSEILSHLGIIFEGGNNPAEGDVDWILTELPSQRRVWKSLFSIRAAHLESVETFDPQWHD
jgi:hypothetical protein